MKYKICLTKWNLVSLIVQIPDDTKFVFSSTLQYSKVFNEVAGISSHMWNLTWQVSIISILCPPVKQSLLC